MKAKTRNSYDLVHRHGQLWLISCRSCRVVTVTQCCATVELTNRQTPQRFYEFSHWFGLKAKHVFGMPLTLCFLHKNDLGIGAEVLPSQDHLLATQNRAAVHVLLLDHGKLVSWTLSCRDTQKGGMQHLLPFYWCHFLQCVDFLFFFVFVNFFAFYAVTWTLCSRYWQFSPALTYHRLHNQFLVIAQYCRKEKKKACNRWSESSLLISHKCKTTHYQEVTVFGTKHLMPSHSTISPSAFGFNQPKLKISQITTCKSKGELLLSQPIYNQVPYRHKEQNKTNTEKNDATSKNCKCAVQSNHSIGQIFPVDWNMRTELNV